MASKVKVSEPSLMSPLEFFALEVAGRQAKKQRDLLSPGARQPVDVLVRLRGSITVGTDTTAPTKTVPKADQALAWVLDFLRGNLGEPVSETLIGEMLDNLGQDSDENGHALPDVPEGYIKQAQSALLHATKIKDSPRRGPVSGSFEVGVVAMDAVQESIQKEVASVVQRAGRQFLLGEDEENA